MDDKDPGQPSEIVQRAHEHIMNAINGVDRRSFSTAAAEPTAPVEPPATQPAAPSKPPVINLPEDHRRSASSDALHGLEQLLESTPSGVLVVESKDITLEFDVLKAFETGYADAGVRLMRFMLPASTKIRIRPTDGLQIIYEGVTTPVTYLGDIHDCDGLLPFKIFTFVVRPEPAV